MPKRPRQAHIPPQVRRRRTSRRPATSAAEETVYQPDAPVFADQPVSDGAAAAYGAQAPIAVPTPTRAGRRVQMLSANREAAVRVVPGQLPTYERAYLVSELRRIFITGGSLMALIIFLSIVLR